MFVSWLLRYFGESLEKNDDGSPLCRARALDDEGRLWWKTSRDRIAFETLLPDFVADRARKSLVRHGLIHVESSPKGLRILPCAYQLFSAYYALTGDAEVADELKHADDKLEWFGSLSRKRIEVSATGTLVHDAIMVICDRKPGPALVLAHVLYWHGLTKEGRSRARITRHGKLWIAQSWRQLRDNPGGDIRALRRHVQWLVDQGYLDAEKNLWCYDRVRDHGRPTLHLRPCPQRIAEELEIRKDEIMRAINRKRPPSHSS